MDPDKYFSGNLNDDFFSMWQESETDIQMSISGPSQRDLGGPSTGFQISFGGAGSAPYGSIDPEISTIPQPMILDDRVAQDKVMNELRWSDFITQYQFLCNSNKINLHDIIELYRNGIKLKQTNFTEEQKTILILAKKFIIDQMHLFYRKKTENEEFLLDLITRMKKIYPVLAVANAKEIGNLMVILNDILTGLDKFPKLSSIYLAEIQAMAASLDELKAQNNEPLTTSFRSINKILFPELKTKPAPQLNIPGLPPVGFDNTKYCNCWANSLLHLIITVPVYQKVYNSITSYFSGVGIGKKLQGVLMKYKECLSDQLTVPRHVSQNFREALSQLSKGKISASPYVQCDPHDAFMILLSIFQQIEPQHDLNLFCQIKKIKSYMPVGEPSFSDEDHKMMPENHCIEELESQASIDFELPQKQDIDFKILKQNFFNNPNASLSEPAYFQIADGIRHSFMTTEERQVFVKAPEQFMLTLKRFANTNTGLIKINTKTQIPLEIDFTSLETGEEKKHTYELVSMIEHIGDFQGGHYIHYQKFNNQWIKLNDARRELCSEEQIGNVLSGNSSNNGSSYLHFYVRKDVDKNVQLNPIDADHRIKRGRSSSTENELPPKKFKISDFLNF